MKKLSITNNAFITSKKFSILNSQFSIQIMVLVHKFKVNKAYNRFEIELPMSVSEITKMAIRHDFYDDPEQTIGDITILSKDKNDIILRSLLKGEALYNVIPNMYQYASFRTEDWNYGGPYDFGKFKCFGQSHYLAFSRENMHNVSKNAILYGDKVLGNLPLDFIDLSKKNCFQSGRKPMVTDDTSKGFSIGSMWVFGTSLYKCVDTTLGQAQWEITAQGKNGIVYYNNAPYGLIPIYNMPFWNKGNTFSTGFYRDYEIRKKPLFYLDNYINVDIKNESRFIHVIVNKSDKISRNREILFNGSDFEYHIWIYLCN